MYELFASNEKDEALFLTEDGITSYKEAMKRLKECKLPHCQIEQFDIPDSLKHRAKELKKRNYWDYVRFMGIYGKYTLIATKHNKIITKYY